MILDAWFDMVLPLKPEALSQHPADETPLENAVQLEKDWATTHYITSCSGHIGT